MSTWKSWDTAPKDGREIIVRPLACKEVHSIVAFDDDRGCWKTRDVPMPEIDDLDLEWTDIPGDEPCDRRRLFEAAYMAALAGIATCPDLHKDSYIRWSKETATETVRQWPEFMAAIEAE
jgi:hypothetical protein